MNKIYLADIEDDDETTCAFFIFVIVIVAISTEKKNVFNKKVCMRHTHISKDGKGVFYALITFF